jgi:hypothetical protein
MEGIIKKLVPNTEIQSSLNFEEMQYFYFINENYPSFYIIEAWPLDDKSDPELYIKSFNL